MKISLLTIWHCSNYGAELQTYATVRALKQLGHEVEVIDFRLTEKYPKTKKEKIAEFINSLTLSDCKFNRFWKKFIRNKTTHYRNLEELKNNPPKSDCYLVGSDQVWNEDITKRKADAYFLNFGDENVLRVSYSSSIGVDYWNGSEELTKIVKRQFDKFKAISCREKTGCKVLRDTFGKEITNVLDPTLLHDSYPELTGKTKQRRTLVFYPLTTYPELESFSKGLANRLGLKFVNNNKRTMLTKHIAWNRRSVQEWVKNIAEAEFVVTHSFHGLAFSIIYRKQFIIVKTKSSNRQTRLTDLLTELGLMDRFFNTCEEAEMSKVWEKPIDYDSVYLKLEKMRKISYDYLKEALK